MKQTFCLSLILLTGCGIYKSNFDCPAGEGIGCKPVGEVLEMIVESEDGEDLFIKDLHQANTARKNSSKQTAKPKIQKPGLEPLTLTQDETGELKLQ